MKRLAVLIVVLVAFFCTGCPASPAVIKAGEDLRVPTIAMADQYAALIQESKLKDVHKFMLLKELEGNLKQFEVLHGLVVDYLEGTDVFDLNQATQFADIFLKYKEKFEDD